MTDARDRSQDAEQESGTVDENAAREAAQQQVDAGQTPDNSVTPDEGADAGSNAAHPL